LKLIRTVNVHPHALHD